MIANAKSIATRNSNQKCNYNKSQCDCKKYRSFIKDYSWNRSTCICDKSKYLKHVVDDPVILMKL